MEALTLFGTLEEFHAALGEGIRVLSYNLTQDEAREPPSSALVALVAGATFAG
jgi:hypothetical protein